MRYNLSKLSDANCKGNEGMIRKNIKHMSVEEEKYLRNILKSINKKDMTMTKHSEEKQLLSLEEIISILKNKQFKLIDYNYNPCNKNERILFRSKKTYEVKNNCTNKKTDCYIKIVYEINSNCIITQWANEAKMEKQKEESIKTRYMEQFDIINKKVKF